MTTGRTRKEIAAWRRLLLDGAPQETVARKLLASPLFAPEEWSGVWETLLESRRSDRKHSGSFYTPGALAAQLLELAAPFLPPKPSGELLTVLDPACGTGNFLAAAARRLRRSGGPGRPAPGLRLCGIDCSAAALTIARARLAAEFPEVETEFFQADALLDDVAVKADLVAGNPPFVPLPMLREEVRARLRERFVFASGRFNLFALFMEACGKRFLTEGGVAALVVPDRFLRNTQLAGLRRWLTSEQELLGVIEPPRSVRRFAAVVDCVGVVWRNRSAAEGGMFRFGGRKLPVSGFPENLFAAPRPAASPAAPGKFPTVALGEIAVIRDGIIQSRVGDLLFRTDAPRRDCHKLLTGRDIVPGEIRFHGRYVDYRPAVMRAEELRRGGRGLRMRSEDIFTRPKILTRQTADRIIAALDARGEYFYANTLHGIMPDPDKADMEYLLFYLNGRRAQEDYAILAGETGRVFAQVKIAVLKRLPVFLPPLEMQREIVSAVRRRALARGDETVASGVVFEDFDRAVAEFGAK